MTGDAPVRVVQIITTLARGGAQATVVASCDPARLADLGVEVTVVAGVEVTAEGAWWGDPALARSRVEPMTRLVRRPAPIQDLLALWQLVRVLRRLRPDVVHTHSAKAGMLGRLAAVLVGVPVVHTVHGWGPLHADRAIVRWASALVERTMARAVAALVLVGIGDVDLARRWRIGRPDRYQVIRSGIELPAPEAAAEQRLRWRRELGLHDRFVVGMVGRLAHPKDQATLVEAFRLAAIPEATLLLVGDGPQRGELERLVRSHPEVDIRLLGLHPRGAELVAAFDVAVHSSHWEGLPRTVVEAAAAAVPVVATDVGSIAELIEDGRSGRLVAPGDPAAMGRALTDVHADLRGAVALAIEARRRADAFSADRMRNDLADLWHRVAGRTHPLGGPNGDTGRSGRVRASAAAPNRPAPVPPARAPR